MNAFRLSGDMTHLLSIVVLLLKIRTTKSCAGISLKTQELYVIVFITRYLDLFTTYYSLYNSVMKIIFLGSSISIVWYIRYQKVVKQTYNKDEDTFRYFFVILPCFLLALVFNRNLTIMEVLWAFSLYLESVAILPQLVLLQRFLADHRFRWIPWLSGLLQTALYTDFFYYYVKSWRNREKLQLPA